MPKPYSQDLRDRVIDAVARGETSRRGAARRYEISESVAIKWLERLEREGSREPVGHGGHRASKLFDGPINGERFHAYIELFLVPTLKPSDVVILDNLRSHKGKTVRKAIRDVGARLVFLPKYSPGLNPIEQVFIKAQNLAAKGGGAKLWSRLRRLRSDPHPIPTRRMRRIHQERGYA
jgi:transposase